jgi:hypothetical protein
MSPAFSTRRRAEQFDTLLDGGPGAAPTEELARLLALADGLRAVAPVEPRADFAASLRERLMAEAPEALARPAADDTTAKLTIGHRTPTTKRRERRLAVAIGAVSLVAATGASAVASQGALPGDTLYPVKRLVEDARSSLTMGDMARADVLLRQARTRLQEAHDLGVRDDVDTGAVERALRDFGDTADHASTILLADYADHSNEQAIGDLRTFTSQSATSLSELTDLLPESVHDVLADVTNALLSIDHSAAEACPACGGGITELPSTLIDLLAATTGSSDQTAAAPPAASQGVAPQQPAPAAPVPSQAALPGSVNDQLKVPTGPGAGSGVVPSAPPTSLGDAVGQVGNGVGGAVGGVGGAVSGLGNQVGGPVGGVVGGVGGAVTGVGGAVGGTVDGVGGAVDDILGGLLGGSTQTPKP